jgi:hypothetical protein
MSDMGQEYEGTPAARHHSREASRYYFVFTTFLAGVAFGGWHHSAWAGSAIFLLLVALDACLMQYFKEL